MPRVENIGSNVDYWCEFVGDGSGASVWDVCRFCFQVLEYYPAEYDHFLRPYNDDPPGDCGRGGDVEHPLYEETAYICAVCGKPLTNEDN